MKKQKKTHGLAYKIFTTILLLILLGGFCTVQAICNIVSPAGLIWFAVLFINFVLMALEDFNYVKTHYGKIPVRHIRLTLVILIAGAPICVMLPIGKDWQPYTFESEQTAIEAARAIPDEQNAAMLYQPLFEDLGPDPELPDFVKNCEKTLLRGAWNTETHPQVAEWLRAQTDTIETVMQISGIPQCRFPLRIHFWDSPDRCDQLKYLAKLVLISGNLDMAQQNTKATLAKYIAAINMGGHNLQQPNALDFVAGLGLKALALKPARGFIIESTLAKEGLLALVQNVEIRNTWNDDWPEILEGETLQTKNHFGRLYDVNPRGRTRLTHHISRAFEPNIRLTATDKLKDIFAPAFLVIVTPWRPETMGEVIDDMYAPLAAADFDWSKLSGFEEHRVRTLHRLPGIRDMFLTNTLPPSVFLKVRDAYMRQLAMRRGCVLLVGLKLFHTAENRWPETLGAITSLTPTEAFDDPTNASQFIYTRTDDGFKLYSKGKNAIDENGEKDRKTGADDILIWPVGD